MQQPPPNQPYPNQPWGYYPAAPTYPPPASPPPTPRRPPWWVFVLVIAMVLLLIMAGTALALLLHTTGSDTSRTTLIIPNSTFTSTPTPTAPTSWLYTNSNEVIFASWIEHGSSVAGQWVRSVSAFDGVRTTTYDFTGSIEGGTIYLTFGGSDQTIEFGGTITTDALTLSGPGGCFVQTVTLDFQPGDQAAYYQAANNLQQNPPSNPPAYCGVA